MNEPRIGPEGREDELTRALRAIYARPDDVRFWDDLERRILARVREEDLGWWQPFRNWVNVGLAAAGLVGLAAGLALMHERDAEARLAYETIVETPRTLAQQLATETVTVPTREATLQYLIEP
jgi:hypothetical protein